MSARIRGEAIDVSYINVSGTFYYAAFWVAIVEPSFIWDLRESIAVGIARMRGGGGSSGAKTLAIKASIAGDTNYGSSSGSTTVTLP
jgi:hypothetical protein